MTQAIDDMLVEAMIHPRMNRMRLFHTNIIQHQDHATFHTEGWPQLLEIGFSCSCSGERQEWRISIMHIREELPEARESIYRIHQRLLVREELRRKKKLSKANKRAKALLHRYLSKEQRWTLRIGYFDI